MGVVCVSSSSIPGQSCMLLTSYLCERRREGRGKGGDGMWTENREWGGREDEEERLRSGNRKLGNLRGEKGRSWMRFRERDK